VVGSSSTSSADTAFTIKVADLPTEQQSVLRTTGFDGEEIVITNAMKTCAERNISSERMAALVDGELPTMVEAGQLLVCYNQDN
jgi:hypothetical protein